jgi:hypothetical protein
MEVSKEFIDALNHRLDAAEAFFSNLVHQEIAKRAARIAQKAVNTRHSVSGLEGSEAQQPELAAL